MSAYPEPRLLGVNSPSMPSGMVTFAFTDIERSKQRWDSDPVAMATGDCAAAIAAAREAIAEIVAGDVESPFIAVAIEHVAQAYALQGELARAAILAGYTDPVLANHGLERGFTADDVRPAP